MVEGDQQLIEILPNDMGDSPVVGPAWEGCAEWASLPVELLMIIMHGFTNCDEKWPLRKPMRLVRPAHQRD
jgi:hypothetical protein